ncbi:SIR2 family protein [Paenibacillus silvae]|uniref:SIR2 family protein n=1 Tax=Paenibacillus silvae TaxID=1325358 RepID=UPI001F0CBD26|nr:SIR2 family protein [Paenibacillus silvae]
MKYDDIELQEKLKIMFKNNSLRPIIGSGFTRGNSALNGKVPSGTDMINEMTKELSSIAEYMNEKDYMSKMKFSELSRLYEDSVAKKRRLKYLENNFTKVELTSNQTRFLEIDWQFIFTLNIDDGIEGNSQYIPLIPNHELNLDYIKNKKCVYKLHGDVHDVLTYNKNDTDQMIFSNNAYLRSLQTNLSMLDILKSSILSLNLIYIGCSLDDEIDILSVVLKTQKESFENLEKHNYYVTRIQPNGIQINMLRNFGITDVILVDDYYTFYDSLHGLYIESKKLSSSELSDFFVRSVVKEDKNIDENLAYLFGKPIEIKNNQVGVPYFFSRRSIVNETVRGMSSLNLQFIYGHRVSGKTYCLLEIIDRIKNKSVYFYPSKYTISDSMIDEILKHNDSVFLFDTETLTASQINSFEEKLSSIKKQNLNLIFAINSSDKNIISIISEMDQNKIGLYKVNHKLNKKEADELNSQLSIVNIPKLNFNNSLLDNIYWIYDTYRYSEAKYLPEMQELSRSELVLLIALATKSKLSAHSITTLELIEDVGLIYQKLKPAIEFVYTDYFEKEDFSGYKLLPNANFWILKTLGNYAEHRANHKNIAEAYKHIIGLYKRKYLNDREFSKSVLDYVKFDTINDIFPVKNHGVSPLINLIYESLNDYMAQNPHYFHQKAKAKLWMNRYEIKELRNALQLAIKSKSDLEISQNIQNERVQRSLSHIQFTIATIQGRIANLLHYQDQIELIKAITEYDKAFGYKENQNYLTQFNEKKIHLEKRDFFSLIKYAVSNKGSLSKKETEKIENLMKLSPENTMKQGYRKRGANY